MPFARLHTIGLLVLLALTLMLQAAPTPATLSPNARQLFADSMRTADASFDPTTHLLHRPRDPHFNDGGRYMVRESSWYALGLLLRNHLGDTALANTILTTVLDNQYTDPSAQWYGSFKRSPEEPAPTAAHHVHYADYDPNWRHFIGTTFQLILIHFPDRLTPALRDRLYQAIDRAIAGEANEHRLTPAYSNIALMYGALWDFAATHNHNAAQQTASAQWNEAVYKLFSTHKAFNEYNSPTYYGVDLYGLALLRAHGSTPHLRQLGASMEATLWTDIADFYSPTLRNIAGPYDRSYGMDMESYIAVTGVWLRTVLPAATAPLPNPITLDTAHLGDLWFAPHFVLLSTQIPAAALQKFRHPSPPHLITRTLPPPNSQTVTAERTATAWISSKVLYGAETNPNRDISGENNQTSQFHPATLQWRTPSGTIGWVRLLHTSSIEAIADATGLSLHTPQNQLQFLIHAQGLDPAKLTQTAWPLPGLPLTTTTDAQSFKVAPASDPDTYTLTYTHVTNLSIQPTPKNLTKPTP